MTKEYHVPPWTWEIQPSWACVISRIFPSRSDLNLLNYHSENSQRRIKLQSIQLTQSSVEIQELNCAPPPRSTCSRQSTRRFIQPASVLGLFNAQTDYANPLLRYASNMLRYHLLEFRCTTIIKKILSKSITHIKTQQFTWFTQPFWATSTQHRHRQFFINQTGDYKLSHPHTLQNKRMDTCFIARRI